MSWRWRKLVGYGVGVAALTAGSYHAANVFTHNRTALTKDLVGVGPSPSASILRTSEDNKKCVSPGQESPAVLVTDGYDPCDRRSLETAIEKARQKCLLIKEAHSLPGISVAVSINGNVVWKEGFGYADVENGVRMSPDSVIRIASISKSMTMAMMGKLIEEEKVDLEAPIQKYLPQYPLKTFEGQPVTITVRHLLSHLSGIRHYETKAAVELKEREKEKPNNSASLNGDAQFREFLGKIGCESLDKAMDLFKNDELFHKPGTKYLYSTHAWTVVSAIIEKVTGTPFPTHCRKMFDFWGLSNTYLDENDPIIFNRAKHYCKDMNGKLRNCPWVDNSCKWAGGGFLSTVVDLTRFAHIMMYSQQMCGNGSSVSGYLKRGTMEKLWTGDPATAKPNIDDLYGLGFVVGEPFQKCLACKGRDNKHVSHSGGAVGACSYLLMSSPQSTISNQNNKSDGNLKNPPLKGVVVAVIINSISAPVTSLAKGIADIFEKCCV